ncbi:uncharacterized protein EDB91DRAFT_1086683 [Suillus paluster]|uniref:uncharacterized protein n=1 Tax=Suillus paluster TaxID=48578 RepID=UPI001B878407|nr:uncharacterized protein EDB91DRAFT_1086683 [Suillus paluster]KAG1726706.1 hypothetical protein EDB91DRAFT_1086683 [Suillus paluster]
MWDTLRSLLLACKHPLTKPLMLQASTSTTIDGDGLPECPACLPSRPQTGCLLLKRLDIVKILVQERRGEFVAWIAAVAHPSTPNPAAITPALAPSTALNSSTAPAEHYHPTQPSVSTRGLNEIDVLAVHNGNQLARSLFEGGNSSHRRGHRRFWRECAQRSR